MTDRPVLVTLLPSTDVDMARWMLQLWGIDYVEEPHAPIFHIRALKERGLKKPEFPLFIRGDEKIVMVEGLVARLDPETPPERRLVPDAEAEPELRADVMDLQHRMRWDMGDGTVHWAYFHFLQHRRLVWPSFTTGVPRSEKFLLTFLYPLVRRIMFQKLKLGPEDAARALARIHAAWDEIDARLADGRRFLCGGRLTIADLAFATSGAPMVLARGYGGHLPSLDACPAEMRAVIGPLRNRPAGQFIQRLYDEFRRS
ncbi:MAG: glutathione S-transferase family protein [Rhodobacteraceae bacterium]|nr:glutathione S-transferase family protein [Paracoccaceae bacterium]